MVLPGEAKPESRDMYGILDLHADIVLGMKLDMGVREHEVVVVALLRLVAVQLK